MQMPMKKQVKEIISQISSEGFSPTKDEIMKKIKLREDKTVWSANAFVGKLLLKELCDTIFIPIDNNAEYLENRGYQ